MLSSFAQSWRDAVRDVVLIVVSITIAFAVDAWWDARAERGVERAHLQALLTEFQSIEMTLTRELEVVRDSERATHAILERVASRAEISADSLARLINTSFNVGAPAFAGGALVSLLGSGDLSLIRDTELSAALAGWPLLNDRMLESSRLLTRNREEEITDYFVSVGVPISRIASNLEWLEIPESRFALVTRPLLEDPAFESMFISRATRSRFLADAYVAGLEEARRIVGLLQQHLA